MSDETDDLKKRWKGAKQSIPADNLSTTQVVELARVRKKALVYFQYGNIIVLSCVMLMIVLMFYFMFPFRDTLSRVGVVLMVASLAVRVIIELFSVRRSRKIRLTDTVVENIKDTVAYYHFRKTVHGPVTYSIVALYTIGFFILTPEFIRYIDWRMMALWDVIYVVGGVIMTLQIRKSIAKELTTLRELLRVEGEMMG